MVANATATETKTTALDKVLDAIRHGKWAAPVAEVRQAFAAGGKKSANSLKKQLAGVMFSGVFNRRAAGQLQDHSGLLCLDLDALGGRLECVRGLVNADPHTVASFKSPTGSGLKVIVRVPADALRHKAAFEVAQNYFGQRFGIAVDTACSDVSRLCFVSHDPSLFFNAVAQELEVANSSPSACPADMKSKAAESRAGTFAPRSSPTAEEDRIRAALGCIPASVAHDEWVRIGMALHAWDESRGKNIWLEWSRTCPDKFNERDFENAWCSFKPGGGVTLGTLFELARNYGWRPKTTNLEDSKPDHSEVTELSIPDWPAPPRPEAFHGVFGEYVKRLAPHTEADEMAILIQLLVGFGNVLGRTAHFEVEADKHYLNLNAVIVGNSSKARKGTSWGHVKKLLMMIDPSWPRPLTGLSTGEGLIHQVRDPMVKANKDGQEEIVDEGQKDKRLLAVETEFGRMLQCSNRENNTLSAVIRQAFDTGDLRVATKSAPERATGAHISIIGHITSIELNLLLTKGDCANGLANRFIWPVVKRSKLLPEGGDAACVDFRDILERLRQAVGFARQSGRLKLDQEAREFWRIIYTALSAEQPGLLGAVCSRAEAILMRIATLLAVTDCSPFITSAHLKAALAIWDYCAASAKFIFGNTLGNPIAEKVQAELKLAGELGVSLSGIYDRFNGHIGKDELHAALKDLHSQGLARFEKIKTSGRPGQIWFATRINGERREKSWNKDDGSSAASGTGPETLLSLNSLNSQQTEWEVEV